MTGTRTPESAQRATVKTDVVTAAEIRRRGAANLAEALDRQPGITVAPQATFGGAAVLQIQGFDRDRVLILEDGERVVGDVGGAIDLARLPVADLARIEIVTGPTSALYGTSALGGVVNLVTTAPRSNRGTMRLDSRWSVADGGKTVPGLIVQGGFAVIAAKKPAKPWFGVDISTNTRGSVANEGYPGVAAADVPLRIPALASTLVGLRGGFSFAENADLRVRARWIHDESTGREQKLVPGLPAFVVDLPARTDRGTVHVVQETRPSRTVSLRSTLGLQEVRGTNTRDLRGSPLDETRFRSQRLVSAEFVTTYAKGPLTAVFGARGETEGYAQRLETVARSGDVLVTRKTPEVTPGRVGAGAAYAQFRWDIGKTVRLLAGARAEGNTRYGGTIAPRLGVYFHPEEAWTFRGSLGSGFRAPSAKETGFLFDHGAYGYRVLGALNLRPERSWGANADATYSDKQTKVHKTVRVGIYGNRVVDLIDLDYAAATPGADGVTEYRYHNVGRALTYGATVDATISDGSVAKEPVDPANTTARSKASLTVGYAILGTRNLEEGGVLPGRAPHTATVTGILPAWGGEASARARVVSAAPLGDGTSGPAFTLLDFRYARSIAPATTAAVGLLNLLDARQTPGRAGDLRPLLGRTFYLSLSVDLPEES